VSKMGSSQESQNKISIYEGVFKALRSVYDPELDENIVDLGFVRDVVVDDEGNVSVDIITSTFMCSPNFVYMMLEDVRREVSKVRGVRNVVVRLLDHHDSDKVNECINSGKSFVECYGEEATAGLEELRRTFLEKALKSRLYSAIRVLRRYGFTASDIVNLGINDVEVSGDRVVIRNVTIEDPQDSGAVRRYLEFLSRLGIVGDKLFIMDLNGRPLTEDDVQFIEKLRPIRVNFSINAELCRLVLEARLSKLGVKRIRI